MKHLLFSLMVSCAFCFSARAQASFTVAPVYCTNETNLLSANTGTMTNCTYSWSCSPQGLATFGSVNGSQTSVSFVAGMQFTLSLTISSGNAVSVAQQTATSFLPPMLLISQSSFVNCIKSNNPLAWKTVTLWASGANSFSWSSDQAPGQAISSSSMVVVSPTVNTLYTLSGTVTGGCANTCSAGVIVYPQFSIQVSPVNTIICQSPTAGPNAFCVLSMGNPNPTPLGSPTNYSYSWSPIVGVMSSLNQPALAVSPSVTTTYTAELRDVVGCVSFPAFATVSVVDCLELGMDELESTSLSLYPNPVEDRLFISGLSEELKGRMDLYDAFGRLVLSEAPEAKELTLKDLPPAVYYLHLATRSHKTVVKVLKH